MRLFSLMTAFLLFSNAALAKLPAIDLPPMKGYKSLDVVTTKNITGSCGNAVVRVMGVTEVVGKFYTIEPDSGVIIVRHNPRHELVLSIDNGVLSDYNGVACVSTRAGKRLLVWSTCGGSVCPDTFTFFVIDPDRLVFLAPKDPKKRTCDALCASRVLGNNLPQRLNNE